MTAPRGQTASSSTARWDETADVAKVIEDIGVDTLGVRRLDAPIWKKRGKGTFAMARRMLKSKHAKAAGEAKLLQDRFAPTTHKSRLARISTLRKLVKAARVQLVPVTVDSLNTVAAALKAGATGRACPT